MKVVNNDGIVIEVTEKAFEVLYKDRGFKETNKDEKETTKTAKKTTRKRTSTTSKKKTTKTDSPTEKKVNEDDRNK